MAGAYYTVGRKDDAHEIVTKHLRPLLEIAHTTQDGGERKELACAIAPSYLRNSPLNVAEIAKLAADRVVDAIGGAAHFALTGRSHREPYDGDRGDGTLSYEDLLYLLNLVEYIDEDHELYSWIRRLLPATGHRLTQQQRADFCSRVDHLIIEKFPTTTGVQHIGYSLISRAALLAYRDARSAPEWKALCDEAATIPNAADRALVRSTIAEHMPSKVAALRADVVALAMSDVAAIPAAFDRIGRYAAIADDVQRFDGAKAREALKLAMTTVVPHASSAQERAYKHVLNVAHRIDPAFANALAKLLDDDPVRAQLRLKVQDHVKTLESKQRIADGTWEDKGYSKEAANSAWMSLGSLNGGRIPPLRTSTLKELLRSAGAGEVGATYPMLMLAATSVVRKYERSDVATVQREVRPLLEGAIAACHFIAKLTARQTARSRALRVDEESENLIRDGERRQAFDRITRFLRQNAPAYLKICDPYFGIEDLELIQLIRRTSPDCRLEVLTSRAHQEKSGVQAPFETTYRQFWRQNFSDETSPGVDIVIVGAERDGRLPLHDRWYVSDGGGIRIGTSVSGLGARRVSEISEMSAAEAHGVEAEIDKYLGRQCRTIAGERATYTVFTL